jgi:hypothetical protein
MEDASKWVDPRGPDGVTIIAQYEQARPNHYPGVRTGDAPAPIMLFDLEKDRAEQRNVASSNPGVVERLKKTFDRMNDEVPKPLRPASGGSRTLRRLKGGELRYDLEPAAPC